MTLYAYLVRREGSPFVAMYAYPVCRRLRTVIALIPTHISSLPGCLALLVLLVPAASYGQDRPELGEPAVQVARMRAAYERLDYDAADALGLALLQGGRATPAELVDVHTTLAFIRFTRNRLAEARAQFRAALSLDPGLALDPLLVSPKILEFFETVRQEHALRPGPADEAAAVRYVVVPDRRPAAALRSMAVPGWGQLYKADRRKGRALLAAWAATAGGAAAAHLVRHDARAAYRSETDPARVGERFDRYAAWHKARNNLALAAAGVWVYSYVDALLTPDRRASMAAFTARPVAAPDRMGVAVTWRMR